MNWVVPSVWLLGIGWCFATPLVIGVLGGAWLDGRTGKAPLFVILGTLVGLAVGIYGSVRMLLTFLAQTNQDKGKSD
ncbi:MAG: AtpZ/AtpI family protein [Dehalococcoidia bacterium]